MLKLNFSLKESYLTISTNISLEPEKIYAVVGPSGAGKSTFLNLISGFASISSGSIIWNEQEISHLPPAKRSVSILFQDNNLFPHLSVWRNLALAVTRWPKISRDNEEKLKAVMSEVGILGLENRKPSQLSGGQQSRVALARVLLQKNKILLLDEPFSGFDPVNANLVKSNLLRLKEEGKTIIFSTHRMESVDELCDHLAMINNSKKILDGDTEKIKMKYKSDNYLVTHDKKLKKDSCFSIVKSEEISEGIFDSEVSLSNNKTYKQLFKSISDQSKVISFKEKIPSMNDIFIMKVKEGGSDE